MSISTAAQASAIWLGSLGSCSAVGLGGMMGVVISVLYKLIRVPQNIRTGILNFQTLALQIAHHGQVLWRRIAFRPNSEQLRSFRDVHSRNSSLHATNLATPFGYNGVVCISGF